MKWCFKEKKLMRRLHYAALVVLVLLTGGFTTATAIAQRHGSPARGLTVPVEGVADSGATFSGAFTIHNFAGDDQTVHAIGTMAGVLTTIDGVSRNVVTVAAMTLDQQTSGAADTSATGALVIQQQASCEVLHLELGPLDLNLLGLVVHLEPVALDIQAQQGQGNLLGNLLCEVVGLLDGGDTLPQIISALNRVLSVLG
jgi:hypothetical protein